MDKLKLRIILEDFIIIGCIIIFTVYAFVLILPNFYFSDFYNSTINTFLTFVIFILILEKHIENVNLSARIKREFNF